MEIALSYSLIYKEPDSMQKSHVQFCVQHQPLSMLSALAHHTFVLKGFGLVHEVVFTDFMWNLK